MKKTKDDFDYENTNFSDGDPNFKEDTPRKEGESLDSWMNRIELNMKIANQSKMTTFMQNIAIIIIAIAVLNGIIGIFNFFS